MKIYVERLFLEEMIEILNLVKKNYDPVKGRHYLRFNKGLIGITRYYKGKRGDYHQILKNVIIEIKPIDKPGLLRKVVVILKRNGKKFKFSG